MNCSLLLPEKEKRFHNLEQLGLLSLESVSCSMRKGFLDRNRLMNKLQEFCFYTSNNLFSTDQTYFAENTENGPQRKN